ncbi:SDR family NAD(P)-dependent oxidoreductase [Mycolicibacterium sp. P1-5]|uniref:SDR family NAD(P)-dependent oxidoreductase n=1 Tax=Mycolicibacterium sp. P1-5 TaxID=2024617 RepID=UPI0011F00AD1|nr:glucose 1-dehydrogenase [Mycolicibacterium sp. P1-5]KAA0105641.1 SDR family oxidoreductase [Mycolicibacterium sp. P1-5]
MSPKDTRLAGRRALVTGSTGGLGVAIAKALAAEGAFVVVSGRDKTRGDAVVADLRSAGGDAEFVAADLGAGGDAARRLADASAEATGGGIDILVNNAATLLMPTPTADVTERELRDVFGVNVFAPFLLTGVLAPRMVAAGGGAIVNIGSITGLRGSSGSAVYSANKAAIHSFTQSWADEYGPHGVRVNAVAPGPIGTERQAEFADHIAPTLSRLPSRRVSTPEEVAAAVVFLVSDGAANVHGTVLSVDGGWAAT